MSLNIIIHLLYMIGVAKNKPRNKEIMTIQIHSQIDILFLLMHFILYNMALDIIQNYYFSKLYIQQFHMTRTQY